MRRRPAAAAPQVGQGQAGPQVLRRPAAADHQVGQGQAGPQVCRRPAAAAHQVGQGQAPPQVERLLRPYAGTVRYNASWARVKENALAKKPLRDRLMNPHVLYQLGMLALVQVLEAIGILGPREKCRLCGKTPENKNLRG